MDDGLDREGHDSAGAPAGERRVRADALRNVDGLLKAAMTVFAASGVDAPVREIAKEAGVGVGTLYRHFPQRSDLITAVFRREIDACADAAPQLAADHPPFEALKRWMRRYVDFILAKRGLAAALHSGDPAYDALPAYFDQKLRPAFQMLLDAAAAAGEIRPGAKPNELLWAVASLCSPAHDVGPDYSLDMVGLLLDGLRYRPDSN
ncbi:TetR/AcrR family transcriptional regulator [Pararhizobium sp.]|uniref:TetR/AcrR family transcriptional regulator n=1 Tax=Pararhizobium sp. TaxID=1977563 RepID=UPI002716B1DF|nr:helix-turn-helix domain-containing protein [Pararhizobium sp.]MDO9417264.1 helix-turn-helix domain-containing protein [Pararhizobium sp.]